MICEILSPFHCVRSLDFVNKISDNKTKLILCQMVVSAFELYLQE